MNKVKIHNMLVDRETYGQLLYSDPVTMRHQGNLKTGDIIQFAYEDGGVDLEPNLVRIVTDITAQQDHRLAGSIYRLEVRH